eukprot:363203-Chlamydomonas_euryale.AAC.42
MRCELTPSAGLHLPFAPAERPTLILRLYGEFSMRRPSSSVPGLAMLAMPLTPSGGLQNGMLTIQLGSAPASGVRARERLPQPRATAAAHAVLRVETQCDRPYLESGRPPCTPAGKSLARRSPPHGSPTQTIKRRIEPPRRLGAPSSHVAAWLRPAGRPVCLLAGES